MNRDKDIRRRFQSTFGNYKAPVPADGWDRLEQSMRAAVAVRAVVRRRWYASSAAALLLMLIGSLLFFRNPAGQVEPIIAASSSSVSPAEMKSEHKAGDTSQPEAAVQHVSPFTGNKQLLAAKTRRDQGESLITASSALKMMESLLLRIGRDDVGANSSIDPESLQAMMISLHKSDAKNADGEEYITVSGDRKKDLLGENRIDRKGNRKILLAFNGRGGLNSYQQTVNSPMTLRSAAASDENQFDGEPGKLLLAANNTADNVSEMEHDQPVSFGFTVSKSLLDNLYLETGLIYTYLSSKVRNTNSNFQVDETQHLHYLGIPLNVNYNLFSLEKLDVYVSVGGMLEKDVYGEYTKTGVGQTEEFNSSSEQEEITSISQSNPQISVNAGVGLSYPIYNSLKLYGKIGGAYYFDANNQYKTIYSDRKIVMDLNVGLRYEF